MAPKTKVLKNDIISAAVDIVRRSGSDAINARNIASYLNCSTQPIFSHFNSMDELRLAVVEKASELCESYIKAETESGKYPVYKASGMAYIRFAREEKELFKLLYMRDRTGEITPDSDELDDKMQAIVQDNTGLEKDQAGMFHLEMWAFVHGIATMLATSFVDLETELISRMLTDAYLGLKKQYETE